MKPVVINLKSVFLFVFLSTLFSVKAQHNVDLTSPSDIWPQTRSFEALKLGASNPLFIGGRDASGPILWGAYPDNFTTAPGRYRFFYNTNTVMRMCYHPWANTFFMMFNDENQTPAQGTVVDWKPRLALSNLGGLSLFDNSGNKHFTVNETGEVWARKFTVTASTIPDFVFDKNYPLMSLSQLKSFIAQNKHLPGIKSASEYAQIDNKVDVGELQIQLLQKMEELTLYILQQQDEINTLREELARQSSANKTR